MSAAAEALQPLAAAQHHLYLAEGCPFCHRVLLALALTGLQDRTPRTWMRTVKREQGWEIEPGRDPLFGAVTLREVYRRLEPSGSFRPSVPLLVDSDSGRMLSSSSADITRHVANGMNGACPVARELAPRSLLPEIERMNEWLHSRVNRAVYRVGFSLRQADYERQVHRLFRALDRLEELLSGQAYLLGDTLTESDCCLLPTLERFDGIYHTLFRCSYRRLADYPALSRYRERLRAIDGVAETYDHQRTREHYYLSVMHVDGEVLELNPSRIVPVETVTAQTLCFESRKHRSTDK